jgi:poly(3-hydroxybutyrate) depolymerase
LLVAHLVFKRFHIMRIPSLISFFAVLLTAGAVTQVSQRSSGCGKPIPDVLKLGESRNFTLDTTSKPSPRNYRLHAPESYKSDVPVPLILSFHGRGKDMEEQEGLSQFSNASYGFEGISVYPEGVPVKSFDSTLSTQSV